MKEQELQEIKQYFERKKIECLIQKTAYEKWLTVITPFRWMAIALGVILPAFLGISIFTESGLVTMSNWKIICSSVLLISSIVSGLHTALKCDSHQQECLRLSKQYESLANKFEFACTNNQDEIDSQKKILNEKYTELIENTSTTPASWCLNSAKKAYQ
ncbi:hypothetical protein SAMN05444671_4441 [Flavobacterium sp. CF108]|jgi:hypothetical protein|uniref:hypothetical protein n=1 Tax=unclassified Flavobacterium TaxID=196869 RepID=UPI0008CF235D|nr:MULTISPECIES: hypothetical protein [unclassified Flavobacterium]SEP08470.1 hypothetical protein SAMN04487978_4443 [Flavobacterium sp. fv08]SHH96228.1 hypothetical protein SAMN05444671_4441 [Flavobacterium sp. CF108]